MVQPRHRPGSTFRAQEEGVSVVYGGALVGGISLTNSSNWRRSATGPRATILAGSSDQ